VVFSSSYQAEDFINKKIKEKTRDGRNGEIAYRQLGVVGSQATKSSNNIVQNSELHNIAKAQIKTNNPLVDDLVKYLTKVNAHQITSSTGGKITYSDTTGLFSTPLGIVTQENIDKANDILVSIADLIVANKYDDKQLVYLTNDYLMLVPNDFGHKRLDIHSFWSDVSKVQYQKGILDGLQTSYLQFSSGVKQNSSDDQTVTPMEKVFDLQLHFVDDTNVIKDISRKYESSKKDAHVSSSYSVKNIYSVKIGGERERFEKCSQSIGNIMRLYHGSSSANLLSIMKQGLIVPPKSSPHVCGRLYGDGVYFAISSSKSANYSVGYWGGKSADRIFMFIADVAMGKSYVPGKSGNSYNYPVVGYDSVWAKGGVSGVINDECIVYKTSQCSLVYLLELKK